MNKYIENLHEEKKESSIQDERAEWSTVLSSTSTYKETEHARLRRKQRCIDKKDLKAAIRFGECEPHYYGKQKERGGKTNIFRYTYQDIVYIVDKKTKKEVTCYARPITLDKIPTTRQMELVHQEAVQKVRNDLDCWTSHTVIVIDTSGSMRTSDMWGTRNRLKSVWFSVALDYIAERIESGSATVTDVVSIITMGESPTLVFKEVPTTWVLYNKIVKMYSSFIMNPEGPGYFIPSLIAAETLLKRNSNASCAAALIFLSDGAPSDHGPMRQEEIIDTVESLAKTFGRRLTFTAIGVGDLDDFSMLQRMVDSAKDYGAVAEFKVPSMTSSSLGQTFTSVATSLTTSQTEMTDLGTMKQRKIRNVVRESKSKASEVLTEVNNDDFWLYGIEDVKRKVYKETEDDNGKKIKHYYETVPLQHPDARYVAMSTGPFGEGAERFAYRFYEVAEDCKTIVGRPLVAKESRMVLDTEGGVTENDARREFVKTFIKTQQIARRLAVKFNDKLKAHPRVHPDTPQVSFLDCSIYELDDETTGKASVLVEDKLDHSKWYKWNSNNGMVDGVKNSTNAATKRHALLYKSVGTNEIVHPSVTLDLGKIEEGSEEEDEDDNESNEENKAKQASKILFSPSQVAQAFSHFSYEYSDRRRLVCDLQGVYNEEKNLLQFSDPVIHYYNPQLTDRRCVHGRTDRGRAGIDDFFATHSCEEQGNLCPLMTRGFRSVRRDHRRKDTPDIYHKSTDNREDGCIIM